MDNLEIYYIEKYNTLTPNGYNILPGGQNYRAKINPINVCKDCGKPITSKAVYCKSCSLKHQERKVENIPEKLELALMVKNDGFSKVGRAFNVSDNAVKKWCKLYGIPFLKNELIEWYDNQLGIQKEENKKEFKKQVEQIDIISGEVIAIYESANEAARSLGKKSCSHITEACNGKLKQAYGYKWKYLNDNYE